MSGPVRAGEADRTAAPRAALGIALSLVSAAALAYEILLARLFSITQWHHFAYMMISVALLGYGAAGSCVTVLRSRLEPRLETVFAWSAALFGAAAAASFLIAQHVPFNALEFLWDASQPFWLLVIYLLLLVPFFFAAVCVCLMFTRFGARAGRVYSFDILGAAAGCLGLVTLLFVVPPLAALGSVSAGALAAAALVSLTARPRRPAAAVQFGLLAGALIWGLSGPLGTLRISPYKELSQTLQVMGTRTVAQASSPLGLLTVVESRDVPFRHAPGLSLSAPGEPPEQLAVFTDGEGLSAIVRHDGKREPPAYLDYLTSAAAFHLLQRPRVLVLGAGTGTDVLQALYHSASLIEAVELNPDVIDLVQEKFGAFSGRPYSRPEVHVHVGEARGFVTATHSRYDLIQIALVDAFGASSAGLYALAESYLYTVESLEAYLERVTPGGYLSITRWVSLPPRDTLKLAGMVALALERNGVSDPGGRLALIRSWKTATLLVKNGDLTQADIAALKAFSRARSFDLDWYPGMRAEEANRYNRLDQSWFHDGIAAMLGSERASFIERYKFNVAPATDDRPYFFRFFRWRTLPELLQLKERGGLPLLEWGYLLLVATLAQALVTSAVLILCPLWLLRSRAGVTVAKRTWFRGAAYFATIGVAFMFVEMAFIQKFILFLSHPLYAIAVVLFAVLLSAGLGSRASEKLAAVAPPRVAPAVWPVAAIGVVSLAYVGLLPAVLPAFAAWPDVARIALSVGLIFPLGFAMGMPFPLGVSALASTAEPLVPWVWGINACASVVSAVLATLLAIHLGFTAVLLIAVALYGVAAACFPCTRTATGGYPLAVR
jgi:hypothetical protein